MISDTNLHFVLKILKPMRDLAIGSKILSYVTNLKIGAKPNLYFKTKLISLMG